MTQGHSYHNHCCWSMTRVALRTRATTARRSSRARWAGKMAVLLISIAMSTQGVWVWGQGMSSEKMATDSGGKSLMAEAEQAYAEGRFHEAVRLYSRAEKDSGADAKIYRGRGLAYEMLNEDRKAIEDYKAAIRMDAADYQSMESLGGMYERDGKHISEAITLYRQALKLDPRPEWKENLAAWLAMLESRLRPEATSAVACWHLGNEKARKGKCSEAETCYSRCVELNPRMFQAYYSRGLLRLDNSDPAAALADFEQAVHLSPEFAQGFLYRGVAYERLGKLKEASEDIERAASLDPRDPTIMYRLGYVLEDRNDSEGALKLYETALKLRPSPELASLIRERMAQLHASPGPKKRGNSSDSPGQKPLW